MTKKERSYFWAYAECTNSLRRLDPGCNKYRLIYGKSFIENVA